MSNEKQLHTMSDKERLKQLAAELTATIKRDAEQRTRDRECIEAHKKEIERLRAALTTPEVYVGVISEEVERENARLRELVNTLRSIPAIQHLAALAQKEHKKRIAELESGLKRVNAQAEHFEREWYLRGDELDALRASNARLREAWTHRVVDFEHNCVTIPFEIADTIDAALAETKEGE